MGTGEPANDFLAGGGEMGALTRAFDWSRHRLGPPETWPQSLRVTVRIVLNSRHPMFIWWGPELIQFYNDAYRATMGPERHPSALGARGRECWDEIWDIIGPQIDYVMTGQGSTWHVDQLVPVTRHGRREDVWWTYSYGPIDLDGKVGGVLVVCNDVTSEHRAREALDLANHELQHRVKNTLAVLSAVAAQTFRDTASKSALEIYQGRLAAFGRAHDLLTASHWIEAPLTDVVQTALAPYRTGEGRFDDLRTSDHPQIAASAFAVTGDPRTCDQCDQIRRAERSEGRISITWETTDLDGEPHFVFTWQETGGPAVSTPSGTGFGSRLITRVLKDDFNGTVEISYEPAGLRCRLATPVKNIENAG